MTPFDKLKKLNDLLAQITPPDETKMHFTTANADTTSRLDKQTGDQLVVARPELDTHSLTSGSISTVFFLLSRDLGASKTPNKEDDQYERLLNKAHEVFKLIQTMTEVGCHLLSGLEISRYSVTPETSIFGGWIGWSIEITFE